LFIILFNNETNNIGIKNNTYRDVVEGPRINNMAHSLVWNTKFVERISRQRFYFDDFREKEAARPVKDTKATRLRAQRAKQMAGRFRIKNKRALEAQDHAVATNALKPQSARSDSSVSSVKALPNKNKMAASKRYVAIPEKPVDNTMGGPNGKKGRSKRR